MRFSPAVSAALWMSGTLVSFVAMAVGGRELAAELSTFQILFYRSLVGLIISLWLLRRHQLPLFSGHRFGLHLIRNLAHFGGQFGWFFGIAAIPLAEVFAIEFTVPVWTALMAALLLKERLTGPRLGAVAMGFAGMLVILRPGLGAINPAALAVLGGAAGYALSHTLTRRLARTEPPLIILFYMTAIQLPLGLLPSLTHWATPSPARWPWVLAVGVTALTGHYCMTRALKLADATVVVPLDFLRLPLIAVIGYFCYQEPLAWFVPAGAALMLAGNLLSLNAERRTARTSAA
ncbi:MAG: DMT family transporter [Deltaproteobacteria bacterium]|nr:DMT family transporter [Candidatus Anaeroferrophillacea bacterium]